MCATARNCEADGGTVTRANDWDVNPTALFFVPYIRAPSFPLLRMWESGPAFPGGAFFDGRHAVQRIARAVVDLRKDFAQVEQTWRSSQEFCVLLSVAAAFTFHQTRRDKEKLLSPNEYANALDIAAAALSCLIPIYTPDGRGEQIPVSVNLARQRFCGGATKVQCDDGAIFTPLSIVRGDVLPALIAIERSGIEYVAPQRLNGLMASPFDERD